MKNIAEPVLAANFELAESPWWDDSTGELVFCDMLAGLVLRFAPRPARLRTTRTGELLGSVTPRASGGIALAQKGKLTLADASGRDVEAVVELRTTNPDSRLNDAACDSRGRLFVGSVAGIDAAGEGALHRLDPNLDRTDLISGATMSNGIGWSSDERTMYFIDSAPRLIYAFDFDAADGTLSNQRELAQFQTGEGAPDGIAVDAEDHLWVASFGGGFVRRLTPDGSTDRTIRLPVSNVTNCAFGGPRLDHLFITTASIELSAAQRAAQPLAGALFVVRPGVHGTPPHAFGA